MKGIPEEYFESDKIWQCPFCGRISTADMATIEIHETKEFPDGVICRGCGKVYHYSLLNILEKKKVYKNIRIFLKGIYHDPEWEKEW